jgi:hypothetical protein
MIEKRKVFILKLLMPLALSLPVITPAQAHGGGGVELHSPVAPWMAALIYMQLGMVPVIGIWLAREALVAWLPSRRGPITKGCER